MTGESGEASAYRALLDRHTAPAAHALCLNEANQAVRCLACAHRCLVRPGQRGACRMRFNRDGVLRAPSGYVAGLQADPIEKKPFFHVLPGAAALSFGMLGCNFHCSFCQNWQSSQTLRDLEALSGLRPCAPETIVAMAVQNHIPALVSTYNEPLITADWSTAIFEKAKEAGLKCGYVSNGFATPEVLSFLAPVLDMFKVDLKCFSEAGYQQVGGRLRPVLDTISALVSGGIWVEIVTLVVPGFNDSNRELTQIADFIASVNPHIPWHVTAFHPGYQYPETRPTPVDSLMRAWDIGRAAGLSFVYAGNVSLAGKNWEQTNCPGCGMVLIERRGFTVGPNRLERECCPGCHTPIPGIWA